MAQFEDDTRDRVLAILQDNGDWMTDKEVLAHFDLATKRADIWIAFRSLMRQKHVESLTVEEGLPIVRTVKWKVTAGK